MLLNLLVSDWRDAAYSSSSEDGSGTYVQDRLYSFEMDENVESLLKELLENEYFILDERHTLYFESKYVVRENDTITVSECVLTFNSFAGISIPKDKADEEETVTTLSNLIPKIARNCIATVLSKYITFGKYLR